jgi:predicted HicB family RNase H-like nuclease
MSDVLKYKSYTASVKFSSEDDVFYARVEGLNDLVSFEGKSVAELKKAFKEAIDDYVELCALKGKAPEKPYKGSFNVRISPELHRQVAVSAQHRQVSLNKYISQLLAFALKHEQQS